MKNLYHTLQNTSDFFLIAGPCAVESQENCFQIAKKCKTITDELGLPYIFKASFEKANRTSVESFSSIGIEKSLHILQQVKQHFNVPILTDIHTEQQAEMAAEVADVLQIPAFLCRQTHLLKAAAQTGKIINIKKGQFASASTMKYAAEKITHYNNKHVLITERGNSFGYADLVVDFRNIPLMQKNGFPVIMDVTHSVQRPNNASGVTGGTPQGIDTIAKAAIAVGANGLFIETHPEPKNARSDGANMLPLDQLKPLLKTLVKIKAALTE